jgi:nucleoside-diphosphate-sugar epimerase
MTVFTEQQGSSRFIPTESPDIDRPMTKALTQWSSLHGKFFAGRRALVTGGAGFIGSHLSWALHDLGARITAIDDLSGGGNPAALPKEVEYIKGSILDQPLLAKCTEGRDFVFHQAALGSVPRSVELPRLFHDVNTTGTLNVMEAARLAGVKRVMFAASSSAYGDSEVLPKVETMPPTPRSPYAATKAAGEAILAAYSASYGVDTASLRYFNIFGPRQSADNPYAAVIAAFAKAMLSGKRPMIYGDGEQSRDFTFVDNAVHANLLAARSEKPIQGTVINIACGIRITVNELAKMMAEFLGKPELTPVYGGDRAGDVKHSLADLSLAKSVLGYQPVVDFRAGLGVTMGWYREAFGGK